MNVALSATTIAVIALISLSPGAVASSLAASPCDAVNFVHGTTEQCVYLGSTAPAATVPVDIQFYNALNRLGVSVSRESCDSNRTLGYYEIDGNNLVICTNNLKGNEDEYEATLIHEAWHVVQDCADGLDNASYVPVTIASGDTDGLDSMASRLDRVNLRIIRSSYDLEDQPYEIEARFMEDHPELVLQRLNACFNQNGKSAF